jgi:hypothetical protein
MNGWSYKVRDQISNMFDEGLTRDSTDLVHEKLSRYQIEVVRYSINEVRIEMQQ